MGSTEGFASITVVSPDGSTEAKFVPEANMVCCSFTCEGVQLLHVGAGVRAYAQAGKTMGIPLLHPWANRLSDYGFEAAGKTVTLSRGDPRIPVDPAGLPIHGVMPGLMRWEAGAGPAEGQVSARLAWSSPELLEVFPFVHELQLVATLQRGELAVVTTLTPTGGDAVPVAFGYHPYLTVPATPRADWQVELGAFRRLELDERMIPTGEREPVARRSFRLGDTSLDDGFDALAVPAEFSAAGDEAAIVVDFRSGYSFAQAYAPAGQDFICFEPMTAPANALRSGDGLHIVEPGSEHRAEFAIRLTGGQG